jgi:hypothetical protein
MVVSLYHSMNSIQFSSDVQSSPHLFPDLWWIQLLIPASPLLSVLAWIQLTSPSIPYCTEKGSFIYILTINKTMFLKQLKRAQNGTFISDPSVGACQPI